MPRLNRCRDLVVVYRHHLSNLYQPARSIRSKSRIILKTRIQSHPNRLSRQITTRHKSITHPWKKSGMPIRHERQTLGISCTKSTFLIYSCLLPAPPVYHNVSNHLSGLSLSSPGGYFSLGSIRGVPPVRSKYVETSLLQTLSSISSSSCMPSFSAACLA